MVETRDRRSRVPLTLPIGTYKYQFSADLVPNISLIPDAEKMVSHLYFHDTCDIMVILYIIKKI